MYYVICLLNKFFSAELDFCWMFAKLLRRQNITKYRAFSTSLRDISIKGFFAAKNYAIVGASTKPGTMGNIICENYKKTFKGEVFYINPRGTHI